MLGVTHNLVRIVLSASAAFTIGLLAYDPLTAWLWRAAFPAEIAAQEAQGALLSFRHGLGLPFIYFGAPLCFVGAYFLLVTLAMRGAPHVWLAHAGVGAAAWAALGLLMLWGLVAEPPFSAAALNARAWMLGAGFAAYLALIGAAAGLLCRLLAGVTDAEPRQAPLI